MLRLRVVFCILLATAFAGCAGAGITGTPPVSLSSTSRALAVPTIPPSFECLPKVGAANARRAHLAYASECSVAKAPESASLQKLAAGLMAWNGTAYVSYCTGTPLAYDPKTRVGFVVSAGHCVVGGQKAAGADLSDANVTTFDRDRDYSRLYQGTPGSVSSETGLTAKIMAVYVPTQYCKTAAFAEDGSGCRAFDELNGDVSVLKVQVRAGATLEVLPALRLAPKDLALAHGALIMALGYGLNTSPTPKDRVLNYIDYQYFANDAYEGRTSLSSLMNGYRHDGTNYSIVCSGDSGGGDFYWDGTYWNLVGDHSWGSNPCGKTAATYTDAFDVSADIRPFGDWIEKIVREDTSATGCAPLGSRYACASRRS